MSLDELDIHLFSDSSGHFRLPDLALGTYWLSVSADGFRPAEGDFSVDKAGSFTLPLHRRNAPEESVFGQVRGAVRDGVTGEVISSAQVSIPALSRSTLTDDHGRFFLGGIPPGSHVMKTEFLGYGSRSDSVSVPAGHLVRIELELSVEPLQMKPLSVVVERRLLSLDLAGFYQRRESSSGIFLTQDQIEAKQPLYTTDIFNSLPGVSVMSAGALDRAVVLRAGRRGDQLCGPTVYSDGILVGMGGPGSESALLDRLVRPQEIAGIEVYTSGATAPLQYKGMGSDCGVIVIWTR